MKSQETSNILKKGYQRLTTTLKTEETEEPQKATIGSYKKRLINAGFRSTP
jgi:hypothetical protein